MTTWPMAVQSFCLLAISVWLFVRIAVDGAKQDIRRRTPENELTLMDRLNRRIYHIFYREDGPS